jgi:hypothetical protein
VLFCGGVVIFYFLGTFLAGTGLGLFLAGLMRSAAEADRIADDARIRLLSPEGRLDELKLRALSQRDV